jgi:hypothetical protein
VYDERNPKNVMPYFPTEHDWSLQTRPTKMPLIDKFPAKFAVNSLLFPGNRHPGPASSQCSKNPTRGEPGKGGCKNPNLIPVPDNCPWGAGLILSNEEVERVCKEREASDNEVNMTDEPHPYDPTPWQ